MLMVSANPALHHNLSIQLGSSTITPPRTARNLGVVIDDQLSFTDFPYITLGRLDPSYQSRRHNSLSKLLFSPDWTIAMLSWRAFQHVLSSLCNWSRMQQREWSSTSRSKLMLHFISLHWLPIAARIKFKALMPAYKTTTGTAPIYLNSLVQTYVPSRSLCSASERRLVVPSQRGTKSLSRTIFFAITWPITTSTYPFYSILSNL